MHFVRCVAFWAAAALCISRAPAQQVLRWSGHAAPVYAVAYSPDGKTLATASVDGELRFWSRADGQLLRSLRPTDQALLSLSISADSRAVVVGDAAGTARLFDLPVRDPVAQFSGFSGEPLSLAVSRDGQFLLTGDRGNLVRLWNAGDGTTARDFAGSAGGVFRAALVADDTQVISLSGDGMLRGWTTADGAPTAALLGELPVDLAATADGKSAFLLDASGVLRRYRWPPALPRTIADAHAAAVGATAVLHADPPRAVTGAADGAVKLFQMATGEPAGSLPGHPGAVTSLAVAPGDAYVVAGGPKGELSWWNPAQPETRQQIVGHDGAVYDLAFSQDGRLASSGADGAVQIWSSPAPLTTIATQPKSLTALAVSPDGSLAAVAGADLSVQLLRLADGSVVQTFAGHDQPVGAVALRPDGLHLATGDSSGMLRVFNVADGALLNAVPAHVGAVTAIDYDPASKQLVTSGADGAVRLWQADLHAPQLLAGAAAGPLASASNAAGTLLATGAPDGVIRVYQPDQAAPQTIEGGLGAITALAFSSDNAWLAAAGDSGQIGLWSCRDFSQRATLAGHVGAVHALAFDATSKQMASVGADGLGRLWQIPQPAASWGPQQAGLSAMAVSSDGRFAALADAGGRVQILDLPQARVVQELPVHPQAVSALAFSSDATRLVTGCGDQLVRVFRVADGQLVTQCTGHTGAITGVAFQPGTIATIASGSIDGTVRQWGTTDGMQTRELAAGSPVNALAWSSGGYLYAGLESGSVAIWNASDGTPGTPLAHGAPIGALALSPDQTKLLTASDAGTFKLWNLSAGTELISGAAGNVPLVAAALSADNTRIVVASASGGASVFDVQARLLETFPLAGAEVRALALLADSRSLLVAAADGQARRLHSAAETLLAGHTGAVTAVTYVLGSTALVTGGADLTVRLWAANGAEQRQYAGCTAAPTALTISRDNNYVYAACGEPELRSWNYYNSTVLPGLPHGSPVRTVALSPDGTRLATGADDGFVRVWDALSSKEIQRWPGPAGVVRSVAFAGSRERVLASGAAAEAHLSQLSVERVYAAHEGGALDVQFLPDGLSFVSTGADKIVRQFDIGGGSVRNYSGPQHAIARVAISPDGRYLAAGGDPLLTGTTSYLWDMVDGTAVYSLATPSPVTDMAFTRGGTLVLALADQSVRLYSHRDARTLEAFQLPAATVALAPAAEANGILAAGADGGVRRLGQSLNSRLPGIVGNIMALAWLPDGKQLVTGGADFTVRRWDVAAGRETLRYAGPTAGVTDLAISLDGQFLAGASANRFVYLWQAATGELVRAQETPVVVRTLRFTGEGGRLLLAGDESFVRLVDVQSGLLLERFPAPTTTATAALSADGRWIVGGQANNGVTFWNVAAEAAVQTPVGPVRGLAFSGDESLLVVGGEQGLAWHTAADLALQQTSDVPRVRKLSFASATPRLAAATDDGRLLVYDAQDQALLAESPVPSLTTALTLSSDGQKVVLGSSDRLIRTYDLVAQGANWGLEFNHELVGHTAGVTALAFAPDGRSLYSTGSDNYGRKWLIASGTPRLSLGEQGGPVLGVDLDPLSAHLATASADGRVRLYDVATGEELAQMEGHAGPVAAVDFHPTEQRLASCSTDGVMQWDFAGQPVGDPLRPIPAALQTLSYSPDGNGLVAAGPDRLCWFWNLADLTAPPRLQQAHSQEVYRVAFNPAGTRFATLDLSGHVVIWNAATGDLLYHQQLPVETAWSLAWSPDAAELAVGSATDDVLLLSVPSGAR